MSTHIKMAHRVAHKWASSPISYTLSKGRFGESAHVKEWGRDVLWDHLEAAMSREHRGVTSPGRVLMSAQKAITSGVRKVRIAFISVGMGKWVFFPEAKTHWEFEEGR